MSAQLKSAVQTFVSANSIFFPLTLNVPDPPAGVLFLPATDVKVPFLKLIEAGAIVGPLELIAIVYIKRPEYVPSRLKKSSRLQLPNKKLKRIKVNNNDGAFLLISAIRRYEYKRYSCLSSFFASFQMTSISFNVMSLRFLPISDALFSRN